jgi:hypothetical protein
MPKIFTAQEVEQMKAMREMLSTAEQAIPWQDAKGKSELYSLGQTRYALRVAEQALFNALNLAAHYARCPNSFKGLH